MISTICGETMDYAKALRSSTKRISGSEYEIDVTPVKIKWTIISWYVIGQIYFEFFFLIVIHYKQYI